MKAVEKNFWNIQKQLHPDKFSTKSEEEQEISSINSAVINCAYSALKTPFARVQYLLELHGIDALGETSITAVDPEVLMEIMEQREKIENCTDMQELQELEQIN